MLHQKIFSLAQTITKNESHTTYRLAQLLFNRGALPIFCLGYAYFRWLDDLIDAPSASSRTIESALKKQKELIAFLYQGQPPPELCHLNPYELMLHNLIEHDKTKGGDLRDYLMDMFSALEFDTQRRYQLSSQDSLDKYSWSLGRAYTNALWVFTSHQSVQINPLCYSAGYAAHQVHILRDFYIDLSLGYYNISFEELAAFGWSFNQLERTDIRPWVGKMS
jgi:phytoene/squalene synthetase